MAQCDSLPSSKFHCIPLASLWSPVPQLFGFRCMEASQCRRVQVLELPASLPPDQLFLTVRMFSSTHLVVWFIDVHWIRETKTAMSQFKL